MLSRKMIFPLLLFFMPLTVMGQTSLNEVETKLMCVCGCNMALYQCECDTAAAMRTHITKLINEGMSQDQIVNAYVSQYGQTILSAPSKEGFNLLAWILPSLALLILGFAVYTSLKKWSQPKRKSPKSKKRLDKLYGEKLAKELGDVDEGELL